MLSSCSLYVIFSINYSHNKCVISIYLVRFPTVIITLPKFYEQKQPFIDVSGPLLFKVAGRRLFVNKRHQGRCFLVSFAKFLRTHFFIKHLRRLLLYEVYFKNILTIFLSVNCFCLTLFALEIVRKSSLSLIDQCTIQKQPPEVFFVKRCS